VDRLAYCAGIIVAALVCYAMADVRPQLKSDGDLMLSAILRLGLPLTANAATVWVICLMWKRLSSFRGAVFGSLISSAWLPPLALWLGQGSAWAIVPAGLLAATAATRVNWQRVQGMPGAFVTSVLVQAGVVVLLVEGLELGTLFIALGAAVFTMLAYRRRKRPRETTAFRALLATVIALSLTLTSLMHYLEAPKGGGGAGVSIPDKKASRTAKRGGDGDGGEFIGGSHRGIILWPEEEPLTKLVPPLPAMNLSISNRIRKDPLTIPFYGVYWIFRAPHKRPPPGSYTVRGTPDVKTFRSADYVPLEMEAHQNFGVLIDLTCCSRIEIGIRISDYRPQQELELILMNTALPAKPTMSLGRLEVPSYVKWSDIGKVTIPEVLSFNLPANPPIAQFDEATVRFHRMKRTAHASARIAIERFVLVPRGR
jgi:hypothetical protein